MDADVLQKMISEYRKKVDLYQAMIADWERELGIASGAAPANSHDSNSTSTKKNAEGGEILGMFRDWQFFNKSQPEAAKAVLEIVGHPMTTQQIMEAIEKGGVKVGGKTPRDKKQNLYTILQRNKELGRAARDTWGLLSWPNVTKTEGKDEDADKVKEETEK